MKKFLLSVAAMAMFVAPVFAQEEQEVEQLFSIEENGDQVLKAITSNIVKGEGNTYTLENAFGSGTDLTFSFDPAEKDDAGWAPITFAETEWTKLDPQDGYTDFILYAPDYAQWKIYAADGSELTLTRICFRQVNPDPWMYIDEDAWCQAQIYYWAEATTGWLDAHYMTFTFDEFEGDNSAVANVEVEENAPAVYYNLQGQKVENPGNGVYIVRQGNKAKKVMLGK